MINWFEKNWRVSWMIVLLIGGIIFYMSSLQFDPAPFIGFSFKSIVYHFFVFLFFALFLLIALLRGCRNLNLFILGVLIAVFYGISDEIHQFFVPGRACCFEDIMINSAGILFASLVYGMRCFRNDEQRIVF